MQVIPPHRVVRTYTQHLHGSPERVFPLLCPVREMEWVNGWDPRLVISRSGVAELDCTFITGPASNEAIWTVIEYDPPARTTFLKVTPAETVGRIEITLLAGEEGETLATVTYAYTALSERGRSVIDGFTAEHYAAFMMEWENELNHFLRTGTKLVESASV